MSMAITPIGNFLSGLIGEYVAIPIVFTSSALLGLILTILLYYSTPARKLDATINKIIAENELLQTQSLDEEKDLESLEDMELDKSDLYLIEKTQPSEGVVNK